MYKVIEFFTDLHDEDYPYNVGDIFPRVGITVTDKRLEELSGSANKRGIPLIEKVPEEEAEKDLAGAIREGIEMKGESAKEQKAE